MELKMQTYKKTKGILEGRSSISLWRNCSELRTELRNTKNQSWNLFWRLKIFLSMLLSRVFRNSNYSVINSSDCGLAVVFFFLICTFFYASLPYSSYFNSALLITLSAHRLTRKILHVQERTTEWHEQEWDGRSWPDDYWQISATLLLSDFFWNIWLLYY